MTPLKLEPPNLEIVILARDEADVLPVSLGSMLPQLGPADRLTVVADHCRDATAVVAEHAGARVMRRYRGEPGKGEALRWWLSQTRTGSRPNDLVVILDADSRARPGFLRRMRHALETSAPAAQARLEPAETATSQLATLAGLSEFVDQGIYDRLRAFLGWPVRLRGTGMGFQRRVLEKVASDLCSAVEDAELTILLAAAEVPICMEWGAVVVDAKPLTSQAAINQRARWLKGQLQLIRRHPGALLNLMLLGPSGWSILSSVLSKPRTLIVAAKVILLCGMLAAGARGVWPSGAELLLGASLALETIGWLAGVWLARDRVRVWGVIAKIPAFGWLWVRSVWLAARSRDPWLRARPAPMKARLGPPAPRPFRTWRRPGPTWRWVCLLLPA